MVQRIHNLESKQQIIHTSQEREEEAGGDYVAVIYGRKYPGPWYRGDTWI